MVVERVSRTERTARTGEPRAPEPSAARVPDERREPACAAMCAFAHIAATRLRRPLARAVSRPASSREPTGGCWRRRPDASAALLFRPPRPLPVARTMLARRATCRDGRAASWPAGARGGAVAFFGLGTSAPAPPPFPPPSSLLPLPDHARAPLPLCTRCGVRGRGARQAVASVITFCAMLRAEPRATAHASGGGGGPAARRGGEGSADGGERG